MQLSTDGLVLRRRKDGEDRLLTLLTADHGVLHAYANGANRIKSSLTGATELFCYSRFVLFSSKGRVWVDKADQNRMFLGIREDLDKLSLASYFAELAEELSPREEPALPQLSLLLNTLHYLENGKRDPRQLKPLLELRLLTLAGYMPNLVGCRGCGEYEAPAMSFLPEGDLLCGNCRAGADPGGILLPAGVLAAMRHILYSPSEKLFAFSLSGPGSELLGGIVQKYLLLKLDREFPTLTFYTNLQLNLP